FLTRTPQPPTSTLFPYTTLFRSRALDAGLSAIDLKTLSEAARSLGAGWRTVMLRIVVPNMSTAILNASLLSVALVFGEFTFANLDRKSTRLNSSHDQISYAVFCL